MKAIAIIFTLICCLLMFLVKREQKLALLVIGMMTLTEVRVPVIPFHKANYVLPFFFLLSEWNYLKFHIRVINNQSILRGPLLLVIFSSLLCAVTTSYSGLWSIIRSELLFKYFALAYAFCATRNEQTLKPLLRVSLWCLVMLTFFGVLNFVQGHSEFINAVTDGRTSAIREDVALGDINIGMERFRVQSMFCSYFDYGYICASMLLLHLHGFFQKMESRRPFLIALACCLFGIVTCNCRIVWICTFLSVSCYYIWCFKPDRVVLVAIYVIISSFVMYTTVPEAQEKVDKVTDIFSEHPDVKGSSLQMRVGQFILTWKSVEDHELLGLGKGYFVYSFENDPNSLSGLYGLESVIFAYLLERGIIGLTLWFVLNIWLLSFFWRYKRKKYLNGLGFSLMTLYLFFALGMGELGSVYPTMILLGIVLKSILCNINVKK